MDVFRGVPFYALPYCPDKIIVEKFMAKKFFSGTIQYATIGASLVVVCSTQGCQFNPFKSTPNSVQPSISRTREFGKKAMTWSFIEVNAMKAKAQYFLFGRDSITEAYKGDTDISRKADLLCVEKKAHLPMPSVLITSAIHKPESTKGGALRFGWSGRQAIIIPNVVGTSLNSKAKADSLCEIAGHRFSIRDLRMAEFHDGGKLAGWSFWVDGTKGNISQEIKKGLNKRRFWVSINDQPANPWD
jgi:hypothetical protein